MAGKFWRAAHIYRCASVGAIALADMATEELAVCQLRRDDWHKMADERAAEIVRLNRALSDTRFKKPTEYGPNDGPAI